MKAYSPSPPQGTSKHNVPTPFQTAYREYYMETLHRDEARDTGQYLTLQAKGSGNYILQEISPFFPTHRSGFC